MISLSPYSSGTRPTVPCLPAPAGFELDHDLPEVDPTYLKMRLPLPPVPMRPAAKLGQIYWPCWGMSRFAYGHVLVSAEAYAEMKAVSDWVSDQAQGVDVVLTDDVGTVTLAMYVASARPFNDPRATAAKSVDGELAQAWILTLTDYRYAANGYQQMLSLSGGNSGWVRTLRTIISHFMTPTQTLAQIQAILDSDTPAYPEPLSEWWANYPGRYLPECAGADAISGAVNLRAAVNSDASGSVTVQGPTEAAAALATWLGLWGDRMLSGGRFDTATEKPVTITTRFTSSAGDTYTDTNYTAPGLGTYYHLNAELNYLPVAGDRADYTTRYAADVMKWLSVEQVDARFSGFVPTPVSAIPYATVYQSDAERAETRVMRCPIHYPWPLAGDMAIVSALKAITASGVSLTKAPPASITTTNGIVTALS